MTKDGAKRLVLFLLIGLLAVMLGKVVWRGMAAVFMFRDTVYWFTFAAVALWGWAGWRMIRAWGGWAERLRSWKGDLPWLGTALLITVLAVFVHQQPGLKIVNDEPNQLATAKALFEEHEASLVYRAYDSGQGMRATNGIVDKRPVLYAWVVAQAHALTGYRESNGFWVTRFMTVFTTLALYALGRRLAGRFGGAVLALLLLLAPMQAHLGNSGGFEMMNLLFITLLGLGLCWYLEEPTVDNEAWLMLTFVLLASLRYESVVFVVPVALAFLVAWRGGHAPKLGWMMQLTPLLLVPRLWLQAIFGQGDSWQLKSKPEAQGQPFGLQYFYDNVGHALNYAFSTEETSTNSVVLSALGLSCAGFWVMLLWKRCKRRTLAPLVDWAPHLLWFGLSLHLLLMMAYFWGQFDDPLTQRLALPTHLWLGIAAVGVLGTASFLRRWRPQAVIGLAVVFAVFTVPQLEANRFYMLNYTARMQNKVREWMKQNRKPGRLVINNMGSSTWLSGGNAVVTVLQIQTMPERIRYQWKHHTFTEVLYLAAEEYDPRTNVWSPVQGDRLGPDFDYEPVWTMPCTPLNRFTLFRITAIRDDHPDWRPTPPTAEQSGETNKARAEYHKKWLEMMP